MIKSLTIKNIQSHKNSTLEFSPGINALVGTSNNGKSAVLRALMWSITNRPLGTEILLSNWAYDSKGKQADEMSVTVEKENSVLVRRKTKTENEYVINGEKLEAVKTDVPEQVKKFFSLSETNIQRQQDAPFLLSLSSGKIAEYFNRIVRLDIIDRVLGNAESSRRKMKNQLELSEQNEKKFEKELEKYSWLDSVENLIERIKVLNSQGEEISEKKNELETSIEKFEKACEEKYPDFRKEFELIERINEADKKNNELSYSIEDLEYQIEQFEELDKKSFDFTKEKQLLKQIKSITLNADEIEILKKSIDDFEYAEGFINSQTEYIAGLKTKLPQICPLCGARMKDGVCVKE